MNLLILPVGWMNAYNGVTPQDPYLGINEKEAYNFSPYDGFCYGISSLVPQIQEEKLEDVLVVWISQDEYEESSVIVGWYQHAAIYQKEQVEYDKYAIGRELHYTVKAKAEDCVLLPLEERNFTVSEQQKQNPEFLSRVANYALSYPLERRINLVYDERTISAVLQDPGLNYDELMEAGDDSIEEEDYYRALVCFNTAFHLQKNIDAIFNIASMLESLFCFQEAILVFEKLRELEGDEPDTLDNLLNLYLQTRQYEKALEVCDNLIDQSEEEEEVCGLLCAKTDIFTGLGQIPLALECLDFILDHSDDELMKQQAAACRHQLLHHDCGCGHHHAEHGEAGSCSCEHDHHCHDETCSCQEN